MDYKITLDLEDDVAHVKWDAGLYVLPAHKEKDKTYAIRIQESFCTR